MVQLEFELAYYDSIVQHFNHYTTRTPHFMFWIVFFDLQVKQLISSKTKIFVSMSSCKVEFGFLWHFEGSSSFFAEKSFRLCWYTIFFTVDIDTFLSISFSIFPKSFAVFLRLICTLCTKVSSSVRGWTCLFFEWYEDCIVSCCWYSYIIICTDEYGSFRY